MSLIFLLSPEKLAQITSPFLQEWGGRLGFSQIYILHPSALGQLSQLPQIPLIYIKDTDNLNFPPESPDSTSLTLSHLREESSPPQEYGERRVYVLKNIPPPPKIPLPSPPLPKSLPPTRRTFIQAHLPKDVAGIVESYREYRGALLTSFGTRDQRIGQRSIIFSGVIDLNVFPDHEGILKIYAIIKESGTSSDLVEFTLEGEIIRYENNYNSSTFNMYSDNKRPRILVQGRPRDSGTYDILNENLNLLSYFKLHYKNGKKYNSSHSVNPRTIHQGEIYEYVDNWDILVNDLKGNYRREFPLRYRGIREVYGLAILNSPLDKDLKMAVSTPSHGIAIWDAMKPSRGILEFWNSRGEGKEQFGEEGPRKIVSTSSELYIHDYSKQRIVIFSFKGSYLGEILLEEEFSGRFSVYGDILVLGYWNSPFFRIYRIFKD